jgi:flagellar FliJ protein
MKIFTFRLDRVLDLRANREREQAATLGRAMRDEEQRQDELARASERLSRWSEQASGTTGRVAPAGTLRNLGLTVDAASRDLDSAEASRDAARESVAEERERYGEARRDRRVVERLREQRLEAWNVEQTREERRDMDDIAGRRHPRAEEK